jgi:hypothetical protein
MFSFQIISSWSEVTAVFDGTVDAVVRSSSNFDFNCVDLYHCTNISLKWIMFAGTPSCGLLALRSYIVLRHLLASVRPTCTVSRFDLLTSLTTSKDIPELCGIL